jgi:uncharacterized membrane protein YfcA
VLAGLLGIGGGVIIVLALGVLFARQQLDPGLVQRLAVGTSLACIVFTSISSMRAHHDRDFVEWGIVRRITPAILIGTLSGAWVAASVSARVLQWTFVVFLFAVAAQMFMTPREHTEEPKVGRIWLSMAGGLIGGLSSLVGVGGGSMIVPLLTWFRVGMRVAIGTSAAIGFFISLSASAGSIITGLRTPGLPPLALGYVYLPAVIGIAAFSVLTAPLGARLAHRLPVSMLRRAFGLLLLVMACKLLVNLL